MQLYTLSQTFNDLFSRFDDINSFEPDTNADGQPIDENGNIINPIQYKEMLLSAWFDTLEGIEGEFELKAENIAVMLKNYKAEIEAIKQEEQALKRRRQTKERQLDSLKAYLLNQMTAIGRTKIDTPKARLSIRNNAPSLVVDDELSFIDWAQNHNDGLLKYSLPEIRKREVLALVKAGENIPCVHSERSRSLTIK